MTADGKHWNANIISATFPSNIRNMILAIPIQTGEQDTFVWVPSKLGSFAVKSSYRANNAARFILWSDMERKLWKLLWSFSLHERHKILLWKVLVDILPTKDRIQQFIPLPDGHCYLCGSGTETLHHLLFDYPITILCWWNSP